MEAAQLLAIVEVPRDDRVRCQSAGCNHSVYRRIHVVRESSAVRVYGSECFKKLFVGHSVASATPHYTSSEGRHLTDEERQLLIENTERLIQQFESEYKTELARKAALTTVRSTPKPPPPVHTPSKPAVASSTAQQAAQVQAKEIVRSKYGVDPELPGWYGLVILEMKRILREN